jgi:hypothetical protein
MQTKTTREPTGSRVPGVIPRPVRLRDDAVANGPTPSPLRRNPVSVLLARLLSALRGDKYMVGAYPPGEER